MSKPDAITVLVQNQMRALVEHGVPPEEAAKEAEERVANVLEEMARMHMTDVYIGVALRRATVYRLRSEGVSTAAVCERVGIKPTQAWLDYESELHRRRNVQT